MAHPTGPITPHPRNPPHEVLGEAEQVCAHLSAALQRAGVHLPSVRTDLLAYAERNPRPLIDLGRCNVATAHRLIAALTHGGT